MNKKLYIVATLLPLFGFVGCSNSLSQDEIRLQEIVSKTQTTDKVRTVEWYTNNDFVRNDVIGVCMSIVEQKIQEINAFGEQAKYEDIDKQVNNNQDCLNARQANINIEANLDKSRITYDEYNRRLNQFQKDQNDNLLTEDEKVQAKKYLNGVMENMDENQVARQGEDQFNQLMNMVETEIKNDE